MASGYRRGPDGRSIVPHSEHGHDEKRATLTG